MTPICPKCGQKVIYIASPNMREERVFMVDDEEKQFITKIGRVSFGYQEHICQRPQSAVEGADGEKDTKNGAG